MSKSLIPTRHSRFLLVIPVLLMVLMLPFSSKGSQQEPGAGPGSPSDPDQKESATSVRQLQETLRERTETLQSERAAYYRNLHDLEGKLQEARRRKNLLQSERNQLQEERDRIREQVEQARTRTRNLREQYEEDRTFRNELIGSLLQFARSLRQYRRKTPVDRPSSGDRQLDEFVSSLTRHQNEEESLNRSEVQDISSSLQTLWEREISGSMNAETRTERVELPDGRQKFGTIARTGHIFSFFVSEDGEDHAIRTLSGEENGKVWRSASPDERDSLNHALDLLEGRARPTRLLLPVDPHLMIDPPGKNLNEMGPDEDENKNQ